MSSVWESCPYLRVKCWGLDKVGLCFYLQEDIGGMRATQLRYHSPGPPFSRHALGAIWAGLST